MEKRKQARSEIRLPVELAFRQERVTGLHTRNVSLGGALIEPGDYPPPRPGETVTVAFQDGPGGGSRVFQGRVTRYGPEGLALVFQEFDLEDFSFLQELMERG